MASIRDICERIFKAPQTWGKLLIGGLLPWTIIGIPWVFGYFFVYAWQLRRGGAQADLTLPEWGNWRNLYRVGLESFLIALVWWFVPLLVLCGVAVLLKSSSNLLWPLAHIIKMAAIIVGPAFYLSALGVYQQQKNWKVVWDFQAVLAPLVKNWAGLIVPGLVWLGLLVLALPLLPWVFFLGVLLWAVFIAPLLGEQEAEASEAPQYAPAGNYSSVRPRSGQSGPAS